MVKIKSIKWIEKEIQEAEVLLSDGDFNILCFSHPFTYKKTDKLVLPFYSFNTQNVIKVNNKESFCVQKKTGHFSYRLEGKVINVLKSHIKIGKFIIELDEPLPKDIISGDFISFDCGRIDIY